MVHGKTFVSLITTLALVLFLNGAMQLIDGMDMSKIKIACRGQPIAPDPTIKGVVDTCMADLKVTRLKTNQSTSGMDFMLCAAGCVLKKQDLITDKGFANMKNLEKFYGLLTKLPKAAQEPIKTQINTCFAKFTNETLLDPETPDNCWGLVSLGLCAKGGIEEACAGGDVETTTEEASEESKEEKS